jgi:hypothetical protein
LARAYTELVEGYKRYFKLSHQEAMTKAEESTPEYIEAIRSRSPEDISWSDLETLCAQQPDVGLKHFEEMKKAALEECLTGFRAARLLEGAGSTPWKRALFAVMYTELVEAWQPRSGVERQLIETMAIAQAQMYFWVERLSERASHNAECEKRDIRERGIWNPPRASDKESQDQAAAMAERFNKVYLRTMRSLRDLRRSLPPIVVQNASQVNVGGQHVNVTGLELSNGGGG